MGVASLGTVGGERAAVVDVSKCDSGLTIDVKINAGVLAESSTGVAARSASDAAAAAERARVAGGARACYLAHLGAADDAISANVGKAASR